jgi:transcriptional regulator with XRE-family HTH domain
MDQRHTAQTNQSKIGVRMVRLGEKLISICELRGLSLSKLSRLSGVPKTTLHAWSRGRQTVNLAQLKKVSDTLEVSAHELIYGKPDAVEVATEAVLKEIFSGDVRVSVHRIERANHQKNNSNGGEM